MFVLLGAAELKSKDRKMTAVIFVLLGAVKIKSQHRKVITVIFVVLGAVESKSNDRTNDSGHCCSASSQSNNLSNQRTQGNQCTLFLSLPLSLSLSLSLRFRFPLFVSSLLVSSLLYFLSLLSSPFSFRSSLVFILCLSLSPLFSRPSSLLYLLHHTRLRFTGVFGWKLRGEAELIFFILLFRKCISMKKRSRVEKRRTPKFKV